MFAKIYISNFCNFHFFCQRNFSVSNKLISKILFCQPNSYPLKLYLYLVYYLATKVMTLFSEFKHFLFTKFSRLHFLIAFSNPSCLLTILIMSYFAFDLPIHTSLFFLSPASYTVCWLWRSYCQCLSDQSQKSLFLWQYTATHYLKIITQPLFQYRILVDKLILKKDFNVTTIKVALIKS